MIIGLGCVRKFQVKSVEGVVFSCLVFLLGYEGSC